MPDRAAFCPAPVPSPGYKNNRMKMRLFFISCLNYSTLSVNALKISATLVAPAS
jgi:hypothetical protein